MKELYSKISRQYFPEKHQSLYQWAEQKAELGISELMTSVDLTELSGYDDTLIHFVILAMFSSLNKGNVCLELSKDNLLSLLNIDESFYSEYDEKHFNESLEKLDELERLYPELIIKAKHTEKLHYGHPIVICDGHLYFQKNFVAEKLIDKHLKHFKQYSDAIKISEFNELNLIIKEVLEDNPVYFGKNIMELNDAQKIALVLSLYKQFVIISGGPGTGKTSIIVTLLRCLMRLGYDVSDIVIGAPTGRAANRIYESIFNSIESIKSSTLFNDDDIIKKIEPKTIHRLLKFNSSNNAFTYNSKNKLPYKVLIIDEVSMVDVALMAKLLDALQEDTKLIFLGDKDQLPSVEAGAILSDLIPQKYEPVYSDEMRKIISKHFNSIDKKLLQKGDGKLCDHAVILNECWRSDKKIIEVADLVNNPENEIKDISSMIQKINLSNSSDFKTFMNDLKIVSSSCKLVIPGNISIKKWHEILHTLYKTVLLDNTQGKYLDLIKKPINASEINEKENNRLAEIYDIISSAKILTVVRRGHYGCNNVNSVLCSRFMRYFDKTSNKPYFNGMPIMITENDYEKRLFNGDTGVVLKDTDGNYKLFVPEKGQFRSFDINRIKTWEPAFAITVHKSQGSEYNQVFLILPDEDNALLTKEIIYTGITRAKKQAVIFGNEKILTKAISKKINRTSGLTFAKSDD